MERFKYPRTPHLPFSESHSDDDKTLLTDEHFIHMPKVVVTVKMDGENTTVYPDGMCHARSIDSKHRPYHSWLLRNIQNWCYDIPLAHHICGEYLYAEHSIRYTELESYFQAFSLWYEDTCCDWVRTQTIFNKLGITTVPVLYIGKYDTDKIISLAKETIADGNEGIVVRNYGSFRYEEFDKNVAKYVRKNHVQTDEHWSRGPVKNNLLKEKGR